MTPTVRRERLSAEITKRNGITIERVVRASAKVRIDEVPTPVFDTTHL